MRNIYEYKHELDLLLILHLIVCFISTEKWVLKVRIYNPLPKVSTLVIVITSIQFVFACQQLVMICCHR